MESWIDQLKPIIEEFRDGEPSLDGDETNLLGEILKAKINLHEGNITEDEYSEMIDGLLVREEHIAKRPCDHRYKEDISDV